MGKEKINSDGDIPLIYLWIYKKFCDKWGECNVIVLSKDMVEIVRRTVYQVPKKYDYFILKEMETFKLIESINTQKYKIMGLEANKKLKKLDQYYFWQFN